MSNFKIGRPDDPKDKLTKMLEQKDTVKINFNLRRDLRQKFKLYATQNNTTMGEILTNHIKELIE